MIVDPKIKAGAHNKSIGGNTVNGFTLIELMVSLTIGLIITLAITQTFVASRATYSFEQGMGRNQENGRFSIDFLSHEIRMAGYTGCTRNLKKANISNLVKTPTQASTLIPGGMIAHRYTGGGGNALADWTPPLTDRAAGGFFNAGEVEPYSDVLIIQYASSANAFLTNAAKLKANFKVLANTLSATRFKQFDTVMITDCSNADIFKITAPLNYSNATLNIVHAASENTKPDLDHEYAANAELMVLNSRAYFIARPDYTGDDVPEANAPLSLMRREPNRLNANGNPITVPMVEGVERMKFMFGVDLSTTANKPNDSGAERYMFADELSTLSAAMAWPKVVNVKIGVVVNSLESIEMEPDQKTYHLFGDTDPAATYDDYGDNTSTALGTPGNYGTNSRMRRQAFTLTVAKRN